LARSGSAASLSLTIGIAFATLVVTAGFLAGPAVLDCSHEPRSFGACLHGKVVDSGLLASEPAAPAVVSSAELASRAPGWIEANATEYETPTSGVAALVAEPGQLDAFGALPSSEVSAQVALVDPGANVLAEGLAPLPAASANAALTPIITGSIDAAGDGVRANGVAGDASVEPPALPAPPQASGRVGIAARGQGRASLAPQLIADLSPVPPVTEIVPPPAPKMKPPRVAPRPPALPKALAQAKPAPIVTPRSPKYDPRFPSVLVLPPPSTGENSSFATLEVR